MIGQNFPVAEYYRSEILDAVTINRNASWWTALLAIRHPKTKKPFLCVYKWRSTGGGEWKLHQKININSEKDVVKLRAGLEQLVSLIAEE